MKTKLKACLAALVIFITLMPLSFASNSIIVLINGQERHFTPSPLIQKGSTLVPMRAFFEALGCEVEWEAATQTAIGTRDDKTIKLLIGKRTAFVNGQARELTVEAQLIKGSTYIPLRFVGEALGDQVSWDGKTGTISILSDKAQSLLKVHFIDVGQADSIYIQGPNNYDILIDGGNNDDGSLIVDYLKKQKVDDIEILVATHPHEDHIGGLDDVLKAFSVEEIIDSGETATTKTYADYWSAVAVEKGKYQVDSDIIFDLGNSIKFEAIETRDGYSNTNNNSVLTKLSYKNVGFLFTGDMESDVESTILDKNIQADILKVGHHGSRTSSSEAFLKAVKPRIAIISVGKDNTYGHPSKSVLDLFIKMGIGIFRTDLNGTIVVTSDGSYFSVKNSSDIAGETFFTSAKLYEWDKYIGNKNTKKFHNEECASVNKISPENIVILKTREEAIKEGYQPCGICKP